jgi:RNA-directed DNA polymerase
VLLRPIGKWLNAGALEDSCIAQSEKGSPQGGVVSPILSNVSLHYVLDEWFEREVQPRLKGRSFLIRYADDFVMGFSREEDARRVMDVLPKRFERYGLTIHPEKTRLVPFERPAADPEGTDPESRTPPGTFDLLGFAHFRGRSRNGNWAVKRQTSRSRFRRGLTALSAWCRLNRHRDMRDQHRTLSQKLVGHFAYDGITGNSPALHRFRQAATSVWKRWLSRRRRGGRMTWDRLNRFLKQHPLPPAIAVHSVCRPVAPA